MVWCHDLASHSGAADREFGRIISNPWDSWSNGSLDHSGGIHFVILVFATYQDSTKSRSSEPRGKSVLCENMGFTLLSFYLFGYEGIMGLTSYSCTKTRRDMLDQ